MIIETAEERPQTAQEIFDHVLNHLRDQGVKCFDKVRGTCVYRSQGGGSACAVGAMFTDEECETLKLDNYGGIDEVEANLGDMQGDNHPLLLWIEAHSELLQQLQGAHDRLMPDPGASQDREAWEREMCWIAAQHGLTYSKESA